MTCGAGGAGGITEGEVEVEVEVASTGATTGVAEEEAQVMAEQECERWSLVMLLFLCSEAEVIEGRSGEDAVAERAAVGDEEVGEEEAGGEDEKDAVDIVCC